MKGTLKNQTVKRYYTIVITDDDGNELDRRRILAESAREAIVNAYPSFTKKDE